jgi:polyribonucleotide nucleotidyltransferase
VVLATVVSGKAREGTDFFPLTVDYREMTYAAGKFPGGFFKREGRPTTKEITTMRLIDRPIRPLFPDSFRDEVLVMAVVLSADPENDPDILAVIGASAAVSTSSLPFLGPMAAVRVGRLEGKFVLNPTHTELEASDLDLIVAGTEEAVTMVEAAAKELPEDEMLNAIYFGHAAIKDIVRMQRELMQKCATQKEAVPEPEADTALYLELKGKCADTLREKVQVKGKKAQQNALDEYYDQIVTEYAATEESKYTRADVVSALHRIEREVVRALILSGTRTDGRSHTDIRPIMCQVGVLPKTHGSCLFTRGETQALVVATLGTADDVQIIDGLKEEYYKTFMLHYNFPPFCTGEVKQVRGPGRREIGHGMLAERSLQAVIPPAMAFPYTLRVVSDILESNGSSSMATVCGATMCLMDAGVPIKDPVAGIAMGLVKEGDKVAILSDILGLEDHLGDMDFKVAGTQNGVTGLQMDIKIAGISESVMRTALAQAREGRMHILKTMLAILDKPRPNISENAPKIAIIKINPEKIGMVIGSGGKTIKKIQEDFNVQIDIEDDGTVQIFSKDFDGLQKAKTLIERMTEDVKVGNLYNGRVISIKDFGAFVEILPGQDGLVHISELSDGYVKNVTDVVKVGDEIQVKVIGIDDQHRVKLSRKAVIREQSGKSDSAPAPPEGHGGHGGRRPPRNDPSGQ